MWIQRFSFYFLAIPKKLYNQLYRVLSKTHPLFFLNLFPHQTPLLELYQYMMVNFHFYELNAYVSPMRYNFQFDFTK